MARSGAGFSRCGDQRATSDEASTRRPSSDRRSRRARAIARASAIVTACVVDVLVLVRLVRRVWRRRPQIRHAEENQLLVAESGRRVEPAQPLELVPGRSRSLPRTRGARPLPPTRRRSAARPETPTVSRSSGARYCLTITTRPSSWIGISTTDAACRTISTSCSVPFGNRALLDLDREHATFEHDRHDRLRRNCFCNLHLHLRSRAGPGRMLAQLVEHPLQIVGQRADELHLAPVFRMLERPGARHEGTAGRGASPRADRPARGGARRRTARRRRSGGRSRSGARGSGACVRYESRPAPASASGRNAPRGRCA